MEVLTSIVSSYLMSNFTLGIQGRSMLTGLTPILNRYALHLERLTTTPPSLETFASTTFTMTISNQRSNRATGMKSLLVSLENDFSNYCVSGIRACLSQLSRTSRNMQTGPIGLNRTNISPQSNILRSMSGSERNSRSGMRPRSWSQRRRAGESHSWVTVRA